MEYIGAKDVVITKKWVAIPIESNKPSIPLDFEHCLVQEIVYEYIGLLENMIGIENLPKIKLSDTREAKLITNS